MLPLKPSTISAQTQRLVSVALSLSGRIMLREALLAIALS